MSDSGKVNIHGKEYKTVALRIQEFCAEFPGYSIETELLSAADLVQVKTTIRNEDAKVVSTGHAEEIRGASHILKTSALETCETSSVGRALAFMGLGGTEIASADEVANAMQQQSQTKVDEKLISHNNVLRENISTVMVMKDAMNLNDLGSAKEAWAELSEDEQRALWVATTKGGIFTTKERETIKSDEWGAA